MRINLSEKQLKSFWKNVDKNSECWIWKGACCRGYGRFVVVPPVTTGTHRVSYAIHNGGEVPDDLVIAHNCDNPSCVNPHHLFLATQTENIEDMVKKGRHRGIIKRINAKLTKEQIFEIRKMYVPRIVTQRIISEKYGISRENVHYILKGKSWSDIKIENPIKDERFKLNKSQKEQIKSMYKSGKYSSRELAKIFNIGKTHILRIITS